MEARQGSGGSYRRSRERRGRRELPGEGRDVGHDRIHTYQEVAMNRYLARIRSLTHNTKKEVPHGRNARQGSKGDFPANLL
jgi:hypothetical protein